MFGAENPLEICIDHRSRSSRNRVGSRSVSSFLMDSTQYCSLEASNCSMFRFSPHYCSLVNISKLHSKARRVFRGVPQADFRFLW